MVQSAVDALPAGAGAGVVSLAHAGKQARAAEQMEVKRIEFVRRAPRPPSEGDWFMTPLGGASYLVSPPTMQASASPRWRGHREVEPLSVKCLFCSSHLFA